MEEEVKTTPLAAVTEDIVEESVTRCICGYLHDDGYMICCDKCRYSIDFFSFLENTSYFLFLWSLKL